MVVRFDLRKGLRGMKVFLVMTKLCQMKCLLDLSLNWFNLSENLRHPIWEMFCSSWGIKRIFSNLFICRD